MEPKAREELLERSLLEIGERNDFVFYAHDGVDSSPPKIDVCEPHQIWTLLARVNEADRVLEGEAEERQRYQAGNAKPKRREVISLLEIE